MRPNRLNCHFNYLIFSCYAKKSCVGEADRIRKCNGRVFAIDHEPEVQRIWMPEEDCPGLAMSRAFGDFCLKNYGLVSLPDLSYRKIMPNDEFVVLATDGVRLSIFTSFIKLDCANC